MRLTAIKLQKHRICSASKLIVAGFGVGDFNGQAQQAHKHLFLRFARERTECGQQLLSSVCHHETLPSCERLGVIHQEHT